MLIKHGRENNGVVLNEMNLMDCKWYEIIDITVCDELGMKYFIWRDPNNSDVRKNGKKYSGKFLFILQQFSIILHEI